MLLIHEQVKHSTLTFQLMTSEVFSLKLNH